MKRFLFAAPFVALALPLAAQQSGAGARIPLAQPVPGRTFWKAELPGGNFVVAHAAIREVSTQQYIVDGAAKVTEVNIDTGGEFKPRFYYLEPLANDAASALPAGQEVNDQVQNQLKSAASAVNPGDPVWMKVVKNYPATTHAGTIEFRLETLEQLQDLYRSVESSWVNAKSETFTLGGVKAFRLTAGKKSDGDAAGSPASSSDGEETN